MKLKDIQPHKIFKTPDEYFSSLEQAASLRGILVEREDSWWHRINGSGRTWTEDSLGRLHLLSPVAPDEVRRIIFTAHDTTSFWHELTHVEQRLRDPAMREGGIVAWEVQASRIALEATRGLGYPPAILNQMINLACYVPVVGVRRLRDNLQGVTKKAISSVG